MKRLTSAQKARRRGRNRRGGKTRQQQVRDQINRKRRRLRENNLSEPKFHAKPIHKHVESDIHSASVNDYAIYGVYKDEYDGSWVLTGLAATDDYERVSRDRTKYSETKVRGRYVMIPDHEGNIDPQKGVHIDRFDTKKDALAYVSADGSNRVEPGKYLVRPRHDPRWRREEVDKDEFQRFTRQARKVWE